MDSKDFDFKTNYEEKTMDSIAVDRMKTDTKSMTSSKTSSMTSSKTHPKKERYFPSDVSELSSIEKSIKENKSESSETYKTKEEEKKDLIKRKEEIKDLFKIISKSEQIDLVFLLDTTGSMGSWIHEVKESIYLLNQRLKKNYSDLKIQTSFVGYKDFDVKETVRTEVLQFTESRSEFRDFVSNIKASGGGDTPEDVFSGIEQVLSLKWRQGGTRIMIHIADAPVHGNRFHSSSMEDDYPDSDPKGRTCENLMERLSKIGIQYFFGYIIPENTNQMIDEFNKVLKNVGSNNQIIQFDSKDPSSITESTYLAVTQSVQTTIGELSEKKKRSLREFIISNHIPNWEIITEEKCQVIGFSLPKTIEEVIGYGSTLKPKELTLSFKIAPNPFAQGATRIAYKAYHVSHKKEVVLKESKWVGGRSNSKKAYLEDMQTQTVAALFSKFFNEESTFSFKIKFAVAKLIQFKESTAPKYMALEPLIRGEYKKFNNNGGWICDTEEGKILSSFSHWTFKKSNRNMMVVDLQGVVSKGDYFLTDPAIHSRDILRFGKTNLGIPGMKRFFKTHVCNEYCKKLGIDGFTLEKI